MKSTKKILLKNLIKSKGFKGKTYADVFDWLIIEKGYNITPRKHGEYNYNPEENEVDPVIFWEASICGDTGEIIWKTRQHKTWEEAADEALNTIVKLL